MRVIRSGFIFYDQSSTLCLDKEMQLIVDECNLKEETNVRRYNTIRNQTRHIIQNESRNEMPKLNIFDDLSLIKHNSCENLSNECAGCVSH